jgi:serine/threonine-protein kinase
MLPQPLIIDRYAIYTALAAGGMATVHLARLHGPAGFSRIVAAKRLHRHLASDQDFSGMLIDEARVAARIRHPNVVSTLDVIAKNEELIVVMEYVHGESVSKLAREVRAKGDVIDRRIVGSIVIEALHGLHAAHEATDERGEPLGIVHRDVSPHNLLLGVDGITRIADFGIAKAAGRLQVTRDQSIKGKLAYMAPEQIQHGTVTRAADVFAASIVLWELLTGRSLFVGETDGQTVYNVLQAKIPAPSELVPGVPAALDAIVRRGLSRDPAERYATAREMALELERCTEPIRHSEIGTWLESVAGEALAERARLISEVEKHTPGSEADSSSLEASPVAGPMPVAAPVARVVAAEPDASVVKQTRRVSASASAAASMEAVSSPAGPVPPISPGARSDYSQVNVHVSDQEAPVTRARASRRWVPIAVAAVAAAAGALALTRFDWRTERRTAAVPSEFPAAMTAAPRASTDVPPIPLPSSGATEDAPSTEFKAAPAPSASAPKPARAPSSSPSRHRKSTAQCTPPYTLDASGRKLFKLECM